jgi:GNAT superfamily N-acetyltransferase
MTIVPLSRDRLDEATALLARACDHDRAADVAEEKLFGGWPGGQAGGTLAAVDGGRLLGVAAWAGRWLRLLAVHPQIRRRGVGQQLLDAASLAAKRAGATRLRTCDQAGNYLTPGIDLRDAATIAWLEKRKFARNKEYENLSVSLAGNPLVAAKRAHELATLAARHGYTVRRARSEDRGPLCAMVGTVFAPAWAFEVSRGLGGHDGSASTVHVAVARDGTIVSFAAHDGNNRGLGWFGPAGTLPAHRGKGLGEALLIACLVDVAATGQRETDIAWVGPRPFYERACGATQGRKFVVLEKTL